MLTLEMLSALFLCCSFSLLDWHLQHFITSFPGSIVMSLSHCLSVCLSTRISRKSRGKLYQIFRDVGRGRASVLLWRGCDTLCTSGFVDDAYYA